jgi:UDP-N-acetylglucosamine acyltransferase
MSGVMAQIHPTAIVDAKAELAENVTVGAYSVIKGRVEIGPGSVIQEHCIIHGHTVLGKNCQIGPAAYVGLPPQHLKHSGEGCSLVIGDDVSIREMASIHRSITPGLEHATRIGDRCYIMGGVHIAHDCQLGKEVILANAVLLGGAVTIGDKAFLGGGFTLHQYCRVGRLAMVAGNEALSQDTPPFAAVRERGLRGYNAVGCRRAGLGPQAIAGIRAVYRRLMIHRHMSEALRAIRAEVPQVPEVMEVIEFIETSRRGLVPHLTPLKARGAFILPTEDIGEAE